VSLSALVVPAMITSANAAQKLQHVVSFRLKARLLPRTSRRSKTLQILKRKIPQIVAMKWGTNVTKEKRDKGFTHCFILTFRSEKDRDTYVGHPDHKAFGKIVSPPLDDVFVIDFQSKG
jgi:hypothetical protein